MRSERANPLGSRNGGDADVAEGSGRSNRTGCAERVLDAISRGGFGTTGAGGAINGEQHAQLSSGREMHRRLASDRLCESRVESVSGPAEFIGAVGSHRSYAQ